MSTIKEREALVAEAAKEMNKAVYTGDTYSKKTMQRRELQKESPKLVTLEEAITRSGLKDGMTISFHHHFRGGDKVVNMVVDKLAEMGVTGRMKTVADGFHPGSEVANMAVLGYDLPTVYEGRGVLEAASIGYDLKPGEMAMRCNCLLYTSDAADE